MATLTHTKSETVSTLDSDLAASVPAPFPAFTRVQSSRGAPSILLSQPQQQGSTQQLVGVTMDVSQQPALPVGVEAAETAQLANALVDQAPSVIIVSPFNTQPTGGITKETKNDVLPSITHVEHSSITILNTLLAGAQPSAQWTPIAPVRRHSMPASPYAAEPPFTATALGILLSNLRAQAGDVEMVEIPSSTDQISLLTELQYRVQRLTQSSALSTADSQLATSLVSLLTHLARLSTVEPSALETADPVILHSLEDSGDPYDTLSRQVNDLQARRGEASLDVAASSIRAMERTLLWDRIDRDLEAVSSLCRGRIYDPFGDAAAISALRSSSPLPPEYDPTDYELPQYEYAKSVEDEENPNLKTGEPRTSASHISGLSEKMRMDLDAVTNAIDRLYLVAPQLHDQRVELKQRKVEELERAKHARPRNSEGKGKGKDKDARDLDTLLGMIGKASARRMNDQAVVVSEEMRSRMELARQRDAVKREKFVEQLLSHSDAGRLHSQDAELASNPRIKDPAELLTLPEFIREPIPTSSKFKNPEALLTLPEFMRESAADQRLRQQQEAQSVLSSAPPTLKSKKSAKNLLKGRSRSLSAGSWLLGRKTPDIKAEAKSGESSRHVSPPPSRAGLDITYVAEYQENLHNVYVMLRLGGTDLPTDIEVEILPTTGVPIGMGDRLLVKVGASCSPPLSLPVPVQLGKQSVRAVDESFEFRILVLNNTLTNGPSSSAATPSLMDASQLEQLKPQTFTCSSCPLPLVQSNRIEEFKDLPSEHWSELLDAWMCHQDQVLSERLVKHGSNGFWPEEKQCLIGGSYLLFDDAVMVKNSLRISEEEIKGNEGWRHIRCLCGAVVGRSRPSPVSERTVYRLAKYSLRPGIPGSEPIRIPLSAFIVEDMNELVRAHATYRFILCDDEDEKPRLLLWLFKPSMRLAYATSTSSLLPRASTINGAKVLFKIIGPGGVPTPDLKTTIDKFPTFAQAEHLYYPLDVCRRLAALLRETNATYPPNRRIMSGLDVGWFYRA